MLSADVHVDIHAGEMFAHTHTHTHTHTHKHTHTHTGAFFIATQAWRKNRFIINL